MHPLTNPVEFSIDDPIQSIINTEDSTMTLSANVLEYNIDTGGEHTYTAGLKHDQSLKFPGPLPAPVDCVSKPDKLQSISEIIRNLRKQ